MENESIKEKSLITAFSIIGAFVVGILAYLFVTNKKVKFVEVPYKGRDYLD